MKEKKQKNSGLTCLGDNAQMTSKMGFKQFQACTCTIQEVWFNEIKEKIENVYHTNSLPIIKLCKTLLSTT